MNDILCGKGKECNAFPGTQRYRQIIDSFLHQYAKALTRHSKMDLTRKIYEVLAMTGSRFLKYNRSEKAWQEVSFLIARDKIGHALRFQYRKIDSEKLQEDVEVTKKMPAKSLTETFGADEAPSPSTLASFPSSYDDKTVVVGVDLQTEKKPATRRHCFPKYRSSCLQRIAHRTRQFGSRRYEKPD